MCFVACSLVFVLGSIVLFIISGFLKVLKYVTFELSMCFVACSLVFVLCFIVLFIISGFLSIKVVLHIKKLYWQRKKGYTLSVGFFHPYCNAGGGGERVLWTAIDAIQKKYKNAHCVVYSGDCVPEENILKKVEEHFNIKLTRKIKIIFLRSRFLVEAKYYPFCTLLMQSLGSIILGLEAICKHIPDVYIDTMGYAWTLPIFKFLGPCKVAAYVHFPTISTDMLHIVQQRKVGINNKKFISNNRIFSYLKVIYYRMFALLYGLVGRQAEVIMVNSSWTRNHIIELWNKPNSTFTVYPPCDVTEFNCIPLEKHDEKMRIVSIAQFRPEKDHKLQIESFHEFMNRSNVTKYASISLVLIGSCRHEEDYQRVQSLKDLCTELEISDQVEFKINLSFKAIILEMAHSNVALHTMKDEHFGIGIVECMSAGLIMISHDSGGPKMDIVINYNGKPTGFLANDIKTFADALEKISKMDHQDLYELRKNGRKSVSRFSVQKFEETFLSSIKVMFL